MRKKTGFVIICYIVESFPAFILTFPSLASSSVVEFDLLLYYLQNSYASLQYIYICSVVTLVCQEKCKIFWNQEISKSNNNKDNCRWEMIHMLLPLGNSYAIMHFFNFLYQIFHLIFCIYTDFVSKVLVLNCQLLSLRHPSQIFLSSSR